MPAAEAEAEELRQAEGEAEAAARRRLKETEVDGHGCRDDIVVRGGGPRTRTMKNFRGNE